MNNYIFLICLIFISNIYMINSKYVDYTIPTNFTLSILKTIEKTGKVDCGSYNSTCPSDYQCMSNGDESGYHCNLGDFLCIDDDNSHCIQTRSNVYELRYYCYDVSYERRKKDKDDKPRPIMETCTKKGVDSQSCDIFDYNRCENNSDCFSGNCYKTFCISEKPFYFCSDNFKDGKHSMKCGKHAKMECEKDSDCFSNDCGDDGYCNLEFNDDPEIDRRYPSGADIEKSINSSLMYGGLILLGIIILIIILCCCCIHRIKKNKK